MAIGLWALVVFQSICQHQVRPTQMSVAHWPVLLSIYGYRGARPSNADLGCLQAGPIADSRGESGPPQWSADDFGVKRCKWTYHDLDPNEQISRIDYCAQCKL
jgi:hypothetical protein